MLILAPYIVKIFYSTEFESAADLVQVFVFGCLGRVISWPLGFIMIAKGKSKIYGISETFWNFAHAALVYLGLKLFGLVGVAVAFAVLYLIVTTHALFIVKALSKFKWSTSSKRNISFSIAALSLGFLSVQLLPKVVGLFIAVLILMVACLFCLRGLCRLVPDIKLIKFLSSMPLLKSFI
jgi:PST family polysaccharide transporter